MNFSHDSFPKDDNTDEENKEDIVVLHRDHCLILSALSIIGGNYDHVCVGTSVVSQDICMMTSV